MKSILFSIYTRKGGHQVVSFDVVTKEGKNVFEQAIEYAQATYTDIHDPAKLFMLTEIPVMTEPLRTPAEWESILDVQIIDPDGWRRGCDLGEKSMTLPITQDEFRKRMNESTIRECDFNK